MSYQQEIDALLNELDLGARWYLEIRDLLTDIYNSEFGGNPLIISNVDLLIQLRDKKKQEGRSTKSVLSATDCKTYVFENIWKRIARGEADPKTHEKAQLLLKFLEEKLDRKPPKTALTEYQIISKLVSHLNERTLTSDVLKEQEIFNFLDDINPFKSLESYLNDAENLSKKTRSQWKKELPSLFALLGVDTALFKAFVLDKSLPSEPSSRQKKDKIKKRGSKFWITRISTVLITAVTVYVLQTSGLFVRSETPTLQEGDPSLDKRIDDTRIFGAYKPIETTIGNIDSIAIEVLGTSSNKALVFQDTIPLQEMILEVLIQNGSSKSYIFEEVFVVTQQNLSASGAFINLETPTTSVSPYEINLNCQKGSFHYVPIMTPSRRQLGPGQEVLCRMKIIAGDACEAIETSFQIVPFKLGFNLQYLDDQESANLKLWVDEELALAISSE